MAQGGSLPLADGLVAARSHERPNNRDIRLILKANTKAADCLLNPADTTEATKQPKQNEHQNDQAEHTSQTSTTIATVGIITTPATQQEHHNDYNNKRAHFLFTFPKDITIPCVCAFIFSTDADTQQNIQSISCFAKNLRQISV